MDLFYPERVIFEPSSLQHEMGVNLYSKFSDMGIPIVKCSTNNVWKNIPGESELQKYLNAKKTIVVSVKKASKLEVCKPSSDYQFALVSNCPGNCEYCYLQSSKSRKPFLRVYANLDEILNNIKSHIYEQNAISTSSAPKQFTSFEVASTGDPLSLEHLTGSLSKTIEFFGKEANARLRVVTKFDHVEPLLHLNHNCHTNFRFSINTDYVINKFEHNTSTLEERINASRKLIKSGYPMGYVLAPVMIYDGWKEEYEKLFLKISSENEIMNKEISFEIIQHRFTKESKQNILSRFPNTELDLDEDNRVLKWGKFGQFKYVYPQNDVIEMKSFFNDMVKNYFPNGNILYFT